MKKNTSFLVVLFLASSCSQIVSQTESQKNVSVKTNWELVKDIEKERWNKTKLLNYFGNPKETLADSKNKLGYLIYEDKEVKLQNWSFGIDSNDELVSITFIPNINNEDNFTIDEIKKNWSSECIRKTQTDLSQHFIKKIYYLECGPNRRIYLSNHDEVKSLSIELK
jgi:hypothetical protein